MKSRREAFKKAHGKEISQLIKAQKLRDKIKEKYELTEPLDKSALRDRQDELKAKKAELAPQLETIQTEMDQLDKLRRYTRKVYPDALIRHDEEGRESLEDHLEAGRNRSELNDIRNRAVKAVIASPEPRQQEPKTREEQSRY